MIPRWRRLRRALKLAHQVARTAGTEQATAQYAAEFSNADFAMRRDALCLLASQAFKGNPHLPRVGDVQAWWDYLPKVQTGPVVRARRLQQYEHRAPLPVAAARAVPIDVLFQRLGIETVKRGTAIKARCPFHKAGAEKNPSLDVDLRKGVWFCQVCQIGGDGIEMWMQERGVSFVDAVREVAA